MHSRGVAANANETPIQSTSWRAEQAGRKAEAILDLRKSADLQDRLGLGCNTIKPMREMLADLLPMNGDLVQAFVEYQVVLAHKMNHFDSLYGAGSSTFALGDIATAISENTHSNRER